MKDKLDLMTLKEAASMLRVSKSVVDKLRKDGELASLKIGRRVFIRKQTLLDYVEQSEDLSHGTRN